VTVLNPAPAAELALDLLDAADWLVPNEPELALLDGGARSAPTDADLLAYAARTGCSLVVTLGAAGAAVVDADRVTRLPAARVEPVDTTGAGDAFVGAFAVGLGLGWAPVEAARLGIACASDSVTRRGTQSSFPDRARAATLLASVR
jgi:ribokinase